jgi:hypothetical protein
MKPKKGKASTSKQPAKKSKTTNKATTKQQNTRKRPAADVSDADSNNEHPKRKKQTKNRHDEEVEEVEEEESEAPETELVVESDEDVNLEEEAIATDNVSKRVIYEKDSKTHFGKRMMILKTGTSLTFLLSYE